MKIVLFSTLLALGSFVWLFFLRALDLYCRPKWKTIALFFIIGAASQILFSFLTQASTIETDDYLESIIILLQSKVLPFFLSISIPFLVLTKKQKEQDESDLLIIGASLGIGYWVSDAILSDINSIYITYLSLAGIWMFIVWSMLITKSLLFFRARFPVKGISNLILCMLLISLYFLVLKRGGEEDETIRLIYLAMLPLIHVEFGARMLNNALNNSKKFTKKDCLKNTELRKVMMSLFLILGVINIILIFIDFESLGIIVISGLLVFYLPFLFILTTRLSGFLLLKGHQDSLWNLLPFEPTDYERITPGAGSSLTIRGLSFDESYFTEKIGEWVKLIPQRKNDTFLNDSCEIRITNKFYIEDTSIVYPVEFKTLPDQLDSNKFYCLVPKLFGAKRMNNFYIMGLLEMSHPITEDGLFNSKPLLVEWVYWGIKIKSVKPIPSFFYFLSESAETPEISQGQSMAKS